MQSQRSLVEPEPLDEEDEGDGSKTAKEFLLKTAARSLDSALKGQTDGSHRCMFMGDWGSLLCGTLVQEQARRRRNAKRLPRRIQTKRRKSRSQRRRSKSQAVADLFTRNVLSICDDFCCHSSQCCTNHGVILVVRLGAGSDDSSASGSSPVEAAMLEDAASVLGLPKKDLARGTSICTMDGLTSRQLAYCLSSVSPCMSASDLLETGGEIVPWMRNTPGLSYEVRVHPTCMQFDLTVSNSMYSLVGPLLSS